MNERKIQSISIDKINILNPRARSRKIFQEIVDNISRVGLKRPITVTPRKSGAAGKDYDLVCGQGRLEGFIALGQKDIPAIIINATEAQAYMMSVVENLARRKHKSLELIEGIEVLRKQGYGIAAIAVKIGLTREYVSGIINLLEKGEERLVVAVESGHISLSLAMRIATCPEDEQAALLDVYNNHDLRGKKLLVARSLLDVRRRHGKSFTEQRLQKQNARRKVSAQSIVLAYRKEVERKQVMVNDARRVSQWLIFSKRALYKLLQDQEFEHLLRAEKMPDVPVPMKEFMKRKSEKDE